MARWRRYVPAHERRAQAQRLARRSAKAGEMLSPVMPADRGRAIAKSVWGRAWCENLERYHDFENRLPRGRTYVRNGSVIDLKLTPGTIDALVQGSALYRVQVRLAKIASQRWVALTRACTAEIATIIELLEGRISASVMAVMTERGAGLFPEPREIEMTCSCPDWATMCKHVAAVLYGVGIRLDHAPALLFELRGVDPAELVARPGEVAALAETADGDALIGNLEGIFGIELDAGAVAPAKPARVRTATNGKAKPKPKPKRAPKAERVEAKPKRSVVTRLELLERGLTKATIRSWFDRGVLVPAGSPGTYAWSRALERRIVEALARPRERAAPRRR